MAERARGSLIDTRFRDRVDSLKATRARVVVIPKGPNTLNRDKTAISAGLRKVTDCFRENNNAKHDDDDRSRRCRFIFRGAHTLFFIYFTFLFFIFLLLARPPTAYIILVCLFSRSKSNYGIRTLRTRLEIGILRYKVSLDRDRGR